MAISECRRSLDLAEVKAKATPGYHADCKGNQGEPERQYKSFMPHFSLVRERALLQDIGAVTLPQLNRFINATESGHTPGSFMLSL